MITVIIIVGIALTIAISLILLYNGMVNGKIWWMRPGAASVYSLSAVMT